MPFPVTTPWRAYGSCALFLLCLLLRTASAQAATLRVPSASYPTIQAAIDAAAPGDCVLLADGTYTGVGNRDLNFGGKDITVRSESGNPAHCIIDCEYAGRGFFFYHGGTAAATVDGLTIRHGYAGNYGGGVYIDTCSPTISHCIFTGNQADQFAGGMVLVTSNSIILNCAFNANSAINEGGGVVVTDSNPTLINCTFTANSSDLGGGLCNFGYQTTTLVNCTFTANSAVEGGGAIYNFFYGQITLLNCVLWGDTTQGLPEFAETIIWDFRFPITFLTSDVSGFAASPPDANGNFAADPQFVRAPSPGPDNQWGTEDDDYGDLRLQATSPCINAGSNTVLATTLIDMDGVSRLHGSQVDLGAYELNLSPSAYSQNVTANENAAQPLTLTGSDPDNDNDSLTYKVVAGPAHGTLTGTAPNLTYIPAANYYGTDSFTFSVADGYPTTSSSVATVSLTVNPVPPVEVTGGVRIQAGGFTAAGGTNYTQTLTITNTGSSAITGPLSLVLDSLGGAGVQLTSQSGTTLILTPAGRPYVLLNSALAAQGSVKVILKFSNPNRGLISYIPHLFAGLGSL